MQNTPNKQARSLPILSRLGLKTENEENKDEEIASRMLNLNDKTTNILACMTIQDNQKTKQNGTNLKCLKAYNIDSCLSSRVDVKQDIQPYWTFRDRLAIVDEVAMKGRKIIIPTQLQTKVLAQTTQNNMGMEKQNF